MFSHWSILSKLRLCIGILLVMVVALLVSSFCGVLEFRSLAKSIRLRAGELPLSTVLAQNVSKLNVTFDLYCVTVTRHQDAMAELAPWQLQAQVGQSMQFELLKTEFTDQLENISKSFGNYRDRLSRNRASDEYRQLQFHEEEQQAVQKFANVLNTVRQQHETAFAELHQEDWIPEGLLGDTLQPSNADSKAHLKQQLAHLESLANELPNYLHSSMENFADDVRWQYRTLMWLNGIVGIISLILLVTLGRFFYTWIFRPLDILVQGSRCVANGDFEHRIRLDSSDEMGELANAMNGMTRSFREIRDDLNLKVQQRTKEVVRGEQLASVGFLAAGVAHEINNPLASIAMCAESLEARLLESIEDATDPDSQAVVNEYLKMIQDEAFRCKEITERLLDFSRLGDVEKQRTDLTDLVESVIRIIQHLGKYKAKDIEFAGNRPIYALVNPREMKQVVLNLLTNSLDSLDAGGKVRVKLETRHGVARLTVQDNGCGMTEEVLENLFEPFFTRRRDGQGTGLGMSITYRIVNDHGGEIQPYSEGPGKGSRFVVLLPLVLHDQKQKQNRKAA